MGIQSPRDGQTEASANTNVHPADSLNNWLPLGVLLVFSLEFPGSGVKTERRPSMLPTTKKPAQQSHPAVALIAKLGTARRGLPPRLRSPHVTFVETTFTLVRSALPQPLLNPASTHKLTILFPTILLTAHVFDISGGGGALKAGDGPWQLAHLGRQSAVTQPNCRKFSRISRTCQNGPSQE